MNGSSLVVIFIPSKEIKANHPDILREFGEAAQTCIFAIRYKDGSYPPVTEPPDLLLVTDRSPNEQIRRDLQAIVTEYQHLHVALHGSSRFHAAQQAFLAELGTATHIFYKKFHQIKSDPIYTALCEILQSFRNCGSGAPYRQALAALQNSFGGDLQLETSIRCFHSSLPPQQDHIFPRDLLIIWNEDRYAKSLTELLGAESVCTRPEELDRRLRGKKQLLILAELTWEQHKYTQFYGYDLARELIARKFQGRIVFASSQPRNALKKKHISAQLLGPIFPHLQLPLDETPTPVFKQPPFSPAKWDFVRNYYLKRDGIVDKLIHDVQKIENHAAVEKVQEILDRVQAYAAILTPSILAQNKRAIQALNTRSLQALYEHIRQLRELLQTYYEQIVAPEQPPVKRSHYKLMIVEDDPVSLEHLKAGFVRYFSKVEAFTSGEAAWQALKQRPRSYAAVIADMELLDADQNWQPMQGFDLIEKAQMYPHLVLYMLTGYSRRALTYIQGRISSGKIRFQSKGKNLELPPHVSYAQLTASILEQICINSRYLDGPQNGIWTNGLLQFYYSIKESPDWKPFWEDVVANVDQFLADGKNDREQIPTTLFHVGLRDFNRDHLRRVLIHRLIVLYYQYSDQQVSFQKGIQRTIGFRQNSPRQYFTTLLGFSITSRTGQPDVYIIQKRHLLREEIRWLRAKFPDDPSTQYPYLIDTIEEMREYLPPIMRHQVTGLPDSVNTLRDCEQMLRILAEQVPQKAWDIALDLRCYAENYPGEFRRLAGDNEGRRLHEHIGILIDRYPE